MLYLANLAYKLPNSLSNFAFHIAKFNVKFDIALENFFFMLKCQILALAHKFGIVLEML